VLNILLPLPNEYCQIRKLETNLCVTGLYQVVVIKLVSVGEFCTFDIYIGSMVLLFNGM
jgi:hypothetical protein